MRMSEQMRKDFDVFWKEKILDAGWSLSKMESYFVWKRAWQASRQSLVVKLPDYLEFEDAGAFCSAVERELVAVGVKYE